MKRVIHSAVLTLLLICLEVGARAQSFDIKIHSLKNGMKILVQEDHSIPNATMYIFYRIGSRNERPGTTGLSHFFEHIMFSGAKKYGFGQFDRVMEAAGFEGWTGSAVPTPKVSNYPGEFHSPVLDIDHPSNYRQ